MARMNFKWISALVAIAAMTSCFADDQTVPALIRKHGYICEEHYVTTEDGYILTLHRIPRGKDQPGTLFMSDQMLRTPPGVTGKPVIMQHGLLSSSGSWTLDLPQKAPAYIMADAGYDVWLTNIRGNVYARNHTHLSPESKKFWQFSWDEMAYYDLPAFFDYILNETSHSKLFYVGHSMGMFVFAIYTSMPYQGVEVRTSECQCSSYQLTHGGTTIFFGAMTMRPSYNAKVELMFGLAPVGTVASIRTPFRYFSAVSKYIMTCLEAIGQYEFLPEDSTAMKVSRKFCRLFRIDRIICENFLFLFTGFDKKEFNATWVPRIEKELLSGTSLATIHHFAQEYLSGKFQHYDFGRAKNLKRYGQVTAPEYDVTNVTSPIYLIWAKNDYLADEQDVQFLIRNLPHLMAHFPVPFEEFNHLDFLWARDNKRLVYDSILRIMKNSENRILV